MTLWAARNRRVRRLVLGETLDPMAELWRAIIAAPAATASRYSAVWGAQSDGGELYFNSVRDRFNRFRDPVDLLYLICRCVKNAVRFNRDGAFTQSVDRRRLGMQPERMAAAMAGAADLLCGRTEIVCADWLHTLAHAGPADFVYLDPPYLGTSEGRDRRYAASMPRAVLIEGLAGLRARGLRFALSYDGSTGGQTYGAALPASLELTQIALNAGRSAQATLHGRAAETIESLYLHRCL
jgi:DNA adenine methylase